MFRKNHSADKVRVEFQCLKCGKQGLFGTKDIVTGKLLPTGLTRHIKQKKTKGVFLCKQYYEQLGEEDYSEDAIFEETVDLAISVARIQKMTQRRRC